ncbi:uncharacterized protein LOC141592796 [Silene latifolia]|uniref:uncharacterized protein LOC141592796 n=1 Tax=Silene latifolia TaxID=37657 RepID=UPI003D7764F2
MVEQRGPPVAAATELRKRKNKFKKPGNAKKMKVIPGVGKKVKVSKKMRKLFRKRATDYNSDSDGDKESEPESMDEEGNEKDSKSEQAYGDDAEHDRGDDGSDEEDHGPLFKFVEGCNAFRTAFQKIMSVDADDESLGPILSAKKRLVVEKLAEEDTKKKVDKEKRKKKISVDERGHVKPANFLDTHDKVLIGIATKGVVKFFNAVSKAQTAQKGLNPSRFKDAKALTKRRKEAFMSELSRASSQSVDAGTKASTGKEDDDQPAWAPLRDSFMLTNSKLKDWDKTVEETETDI